MDTKSERRISPVRGPLLTKAMTRFRDELGDDDLSFSDVVSPEELLAQTMALQPSKPWAGGSSSSLVRLESILSHINDFSAIIAICSGADTKVAGLVWGSIKAMLMLASPAEDTLNAIINMLDELSLSLPRFRSYEETLPLTPSLESALIDVYGEMTCFCARTIKFFRAAPHHFLIRTGWDKFHRDFDRTIKRLKHLSHIVDREAETVRLRTDMTKNAELVETLAKLKDVQISVALSPYTEAGFKCVVLYGLGGIGKTRTALQYATESRSQYEAVFWISAETDMKMNKSYVEACQKLGLMPKDSNAEDAAEAQTSLNAWLAETQLRWLLVFDNVTDAESLASALPETPSGSVLVTSRDASVAFGTPATTYQVKPFDKSVGAQALLGLLGRGSASEQDQAAAAHIVETVGGLPLAINQISGFITKQRLALKDFVPFYERNAAKIAVRKVSSDDYSHTLDTVWQIALDGLSESSSTLEKLLAFFDPDQIKESIFQEGARELHNETFLFLEVEMEFLDAKEELLRAALIDRDLDTSSLSIHRLVQAAVIGKLSPSERVEIFDCVIAILGTGFPNTWNVVASHQFAAWPQCEIRLPHIAHLIRQGEKYQINPSHPALYAETILRYAWHLYERELYHESRQFIDTALKVVHERDSPMYASICMLHGLIELDRNLLYKALDSFKAALDIRKRRLSSDDPLIASTYNALSLTYTELGEFDLAIQCGNQAIDIRLCTDIDRITNSYSNMSSTLLRMGLPDEAEDMLKRCPALKDFTDESFLSMGNPRFAGDMILLSRIRERQGRVDEALRLASKALTFRQSTHGNRLKTCDSLQQVAGLLQLRGDLNSAIVLYEQSIEAAEQLIEGKSYLARAHYKLGKIFAVLGEIHSSGEHYRHAIEAYNIAIRDREPLSGDTEEQYDKLVPWMLW